MKALRFICIATLVIALILVGTGTVLAKGPSDNAKGPSDKAQGKGPQYHGERQGFCGNVTSVQDGNVTLVTEQGWTVTACLTGEFRYKMPKVLNRWAVGNATEFAAHFEGGNLDSLPGRKVAVLACNVEGAAPPGVFSGDALFQPAFQKLQR